MKFRKQYIASEQPIEGIGADFIEERFGQLRVYRPLLFIDRPAG